MLAALFARLNCHDITVLLGVHNRPTHRLHCLDRIFTVGRFIRQHHRVGTLDDRIGNVAHFGARWLRIVNHTAHHLCRDDTELRIFTTESDDTSLDNWHDLRPGFNRQVATRHHNAVTRLDDLLQMFIRDR